MQPNSYGAPYPPYATQFTGAPPVAGGLGYSPPYRPTPHGCDGGVPPPGGCFYGAAADAAPGPPPGYYGSGGAGGPMRQPHEGAPPPYGGEGGHAEGGKGGEAKGKGGKAGGKGKGGKGGRGGGAGRWGGGRMGKFERAKNDYAQHFVDTGLRPANFIRDSDVAERFEEYPKLKELIEHKDALIAERATPLTGKRVDLKTFDLTTLGTKFDVILIDPPWEEYRRRRVACGGDDAADMEVWTPQEIMNLRIDAISDTPSFCFLWSGSGVSLQWGRACLRKWGFRRCEDISWIKSNRETGRNHHWLPDSVLTVTTEHCLVGIKGTVRRNYDGHIINANVDTDVMLSEEPPYGSCEKPTELYSIIEHFANGRRRLELFGEDNNMRRGWLTLGSELTSNNHDPNTWRAHFEGQHESYNFEGELPTLIPNHLLGTTPIIEALRPKSPTQLREEAERRQKLERERLEAADREAIALEVAAAREMGIELAPREPCPELPVTPLPTVFVEQHPFNMT
ncbi:hypothetical protein AB1Y20_015998 [Prymnesium parvum]|uniref:Uncharacterized protein n=1 Tax=Prymnesium parvum TaxID=97485 RepID=A0AB34K2I7_PRYPA